MKRKFILTSLALTFCMGMYAEQPVTIKTDSMRRIDLEEVMIHATKTGALLKGRGGDQAADRSFGDQ